MLDVNEWLAALRDADTPVDGFTTRDICAALNIKESRAHKILRELAVRGRITHVGFRSITRIDGQSAKVPVYQLKGELNGRKEDQEARQESQPQAQPRGARKRARRSAGR